MVNSNIWHTSTPLRDIRLYNLSDLDFNRPRPLKVKCDGIIRLPIYEFLLLVNNNTGSNLVPLRAIRLLKSE